MFLTLIVGALCWSLFCYAFPCVVSSLTIILTRKRKLVALLKLSSWCLVTVSVLWLFLKIPWIGLLCVIVVFTDHTHFLLYFDCFLAVVWL